MTRRNVGFFLPVAALAAGIGFAYTVVADESASKTTLGRRAMLMSPDALQMPLPPRASIRQISMQLAQSVPAGSEPILSNSTPQAAAISSAAEKVQIRGSVAEPVKPVEAIKAPVEEAPVVAEPVKAPEAEVAKPAIAIMASLPAPIAAPVVVPAPAKPPVEEVVPKEQERPQPQPVVEPKADLKALAPVEPSKEQVEEKAKEPTVEPADPNQYRVGVDDVMEIGVIQPEPMLSTVTVTPDGYITFPYIGTLRVKDLTLAEVQDLVTQRLADGYMRYPVVTVALKESRSRKFFVYGEVAKPGSYPMEANMTILRAISVAGGFTKYSNTSKVKLLRPNVGGPGYQPLNVNIKSVMSGNATEDMLLQSGDMVVVSEGMF